ncbi:MAG: chemotaxis protein CheX [Planctomycetes bacterium]|nr:chemotaxis protein CheX [Planctomycetota bacterium]
MSSQAEATEISVIEHSDCVWDSVTEVFQTTCGVDAKQVEAEEEGFGGHKVLVSIISIVGDIDWSIFLGMIEPTAVACVKHFAGFDVPFDSEDMGDAIGELTNILAGRIKAALDQRSIGGDISLPSVMRADNVEVLLESDSSTAKACYECEAGKFWVGVVVGKAAD